MKPKTLTLNLGQPDALEAFDRIDVLKLTVQKYLPDFAKKVQAVMSDQGDVSLTIPREAFPGTYTDDEYMLLGMAIDYAAVHGVTVQVDIRMRER